MISRVGHSIPNDQKSLTRIAKLCIPGAVDPKYRRPVSNTRK